MVTVEVGGNSLKGGGGGNQTTVVLHEPSDNVQTSKGTTLIKIRDHKKISCSPDRTSRKGK